MPQSRCPFFLSCIILLDPSVFLLNFTFQSVTLGPTHELIPQLTRFFFAVLRYFENILPLIGSL